MSYKTGNSKPLEEITLEDILENPIWEWSLDGEDNDEQDETWQRPIIETDNVTMEMYNPTISLKIKNTDLFGSAEYDYETESLSAISIWKENEWILLSDFEKSTPITFISIPKINGIENVEFVCDNIMSDIANRK
jgi:hypothetical protein